MTELTKLQYEQALTTLREQYNMLIAIVSLFFTADLAIVGFAIEAKSPMMLLMACVIPVVIFAVTIEMRRHMHPFIFYCVHVEKENELSPGVMTTYIGSAFSRRAASVIRETIEEPTRDVVEKADMVRRATLPDFILKFCLPYYGTFFVLQIALAVLGFVGWEHDPAAAMP